MPIPMVDLTDISSPHTVLFRSELNAASLIWHLLEAGESISRKGSREHDGVFFIVSGDIAVFSPEGKTAVPEQTLIRFPYGQDWSLRANKKTCLLEIIRTLDVADRQVLAEDPQKNGKLLLCNQNESPTYREEIKSAKTVSRMLLPEGYVPRLCIGTVQTTGPDDVGAHEHPMLDQFFFGLAGCRCTVYADGDSSRLMEKKLLHIPLASRHRVSVAKGELLNYMWIDLFETLEGEAYIAQAHTVDLPEG